MLNWNQLKDPEESIVFLVKNYANNLVNRAPEETAVSKAGTVERSLLFIFHDFGSSETMIS
jgi:hypothetical protein